jgi:tape measure domain-containing protein
MALKWDITGDNYQFLKTLQESEDGVRHTSQVIEREGGSIETTFKRIQQAAALSVAGFSAQAFIRQAASIRGEFQKLEVAFSTMLESEEKANALMQQLTKTAAITPFDLKGVADGAKQLMAYGVAADEVNDVLIHLGDIAAGLSLPLGDLVYLYGTTMTQGRMFTQDLRQFMGRGIPLADELAKQFGVAKEKVGELVTAGKVGADEFKKAIMSLSSEGGKFGGLMEKQSKTIQGQISNIEDAIDVMFNDIGKQSEGAINASLDLVSTLVEHWEEVGTAILAAAEAYGIYKATLMTMTAFNSAATNIGYDAEIASLSKLLPMKEAEANADLQIAVAEGRLSASKAETIASMRMELNERLKVLAVKEAAAKADYKAALEQHLIAQRNMAVAQSQVKIALETGTAEEIAAAKRGAATAKQELQTAAIAKNTAHKELNTVSTQKNALANGLDAAATAGNTAATGILTQAKLALKRAIDAVNASFLASPIFWIAAAIAGVTFAIYKLVTAETAEEAARRKANEQIDEFNKKLDEQEAKIKEHIATIKSETATEYQKVRAYEALKQLMPTLTNEYSRAEIAALDMVDAQQKINETLDNAEYEDAKAKVEGYKKSIENINDLMLQDARYNGGRNALFNLNQLERAEAMLAEAEKRLNSILELRRKAAEEARPIEIRLKEAQDNEAVRKRIFDFYDKAMALTADLQSANETINFTTGQTRLDEFIENAQKEIDDLREQQEKNPIDEYLRIELNEKQKILNDLLAMKANWTTMGVLNLPFTFTVNYASAQAAMEAAKQKAAGLAAQQANTPTLADAYNKAQKAYKDAKEKVDKMSKNRSAYTQADWDKAQEELKDAKTTYSGLGGDTSEKGSKNAAKTRQQRLREQQRYNDMERRLALDKQRTSVDLQFSTDQAVIDAMEDGSKKTLAQIQLDYRKQKEEIQRGYEDLKQQKIDNARQLFEANPANKDKVFDPSKVNTDYTDEETANYEAQMRANEETYQRSLRDQQNAQRQALLDYIKEYGSIQDQKLAIAKEYEQRIAKEQGIIQKRALEAERDRTLSELDMKELQQSINWEDVFGDLSRKSVSSLRQLRDRLRQALDTKDITVENAQILSDKIAEIGNAITDKTDILASILPGLRERKRLTEQATAAEELYRKALEKEAESINKVLADKREIQDLLNEAQIRDAFGQKITVELEAISEENKERLLASLDKDSDLYKKLLELFENLAADVTDQNNNHATSEAKRSYAKELKDSLNDGNFKQILSNLFNFEGMGFTEIASLVNTNAQSLSDFIDKIGLENTDFGQAVHGFADGVGGFNNAIQSLANGDVFGAVNGVLDGIAGFGRMGATIFGGSGNEDDMEAEIANLSKANENLAMAIEKLSQRINDKSSTNSQSLEAYREALAGEKDWQKNQLEAINARASEWTNTGYGFLGLGGKSSFNAHMAGNDWYGWDKFDEVLKKHFGESGIEHNSVNRNTIWELTPEEMSLLQQFAPKEWQALMNGDGHRNPQDLVNEYIERAGMIESLTSALNEKLTGYSWDSFLDSYKSLLKDLDSTTEDFADHIQELISNALIEAFVNGEAVQGKIKDLYKKIAQYASEDSDGGTDLTKDEINDIKAANEDIANTLLAWREAAKQAGLITSSNEEPYEQEATKGAWQGMSEDTGQELNGRFTALQVAGENISNQMTLAVTQINLITGFTQSSNHYLMDIRNSIIMGNTYLEDIAKYSKAIYSEFASKLDTIANNTKY